MPYSLIHTYCREGKGDDDFPRKEARILEFLVVSTTAFARFVANGAHIDYATHKTIPYDYTAHSNLPKYGSFWTGPKSPRARKSLMTARIEEGFTVPVRTGVRWRET